MQLPRTGHPSHSTPADDDLAQTLACSLILSRIDYCNAVLHGAPTYTIRKLQRVQNNAAPIVLQAPRRSHATPLLNTLHWLPVQQRTDYKVALLTFKVRSTSFAARRPTSIAYSRTERTSTICDDNRPLRRCADRSPRQQWQSAHSAAQHQPSGTRCQRQFWTVTL